MDILNEYFKKYSLISNKDAETLGIKRHKLAELVKQGVLERVRNGVYKRKDCEMDVLAAISLNNDKITFSFHTALYLLGLIDVEQSSIHISVPQGYNANHIKKHKADIIVHYIKKENFESGIINIHTAHGHTVSCYDMERSICDIISERKHIDKQLFIEAINRYFRRRDKDIRKLLKYSRIVGVEDDISQYMEVLLGI